MSFVFSPKKQSLCYYCYDHELAIALSESVELAELVGKLYAAEKMAEVEAKENGGMGFFFLSLYFCHKHLYQQLIETQNEEENARFLLSQKRVSFCIYLSAKERDKREVKAERN